MLRQKIDEVRAVRKQHPRFFWFAVVVLFLFGLQMVLKVEITPLGYFSLYSDPAYPQKEYKQFLPVNVVRKPNTVSTKVDLMNIYKAPGTGFLMLEILPSRYDILKRSDHCNQVNHKLQRLGLHDNNQSDCKQLEEFNKWFDIYLERINMKEKGMTCLLMEASFSHGEFINLNFGK